MLIEASWHSGSPFSHLTGSESPQLLVAAADRNAVMFNSTPIPTSAATTLTPALRRLNDFGLSAGSPWPELDDLTVVASRLFGASTSMILIIDETNQMNTISLSGSKAVGHELESLVHSASAQVAARDQPIAICDLDSYLGVPIHGSVGDPIGVLCVIDQGSKGWGEHDLTDLQRLAGAAGNAIALKAATLGAQGRCDEHLKFAASLIEDLNVSTHSARLVLNDLETELPPAVRPAQLQDTIDLAARVSESLEGLSVGLHQHLDVLRAPPVDHDDEVDLEEVIDEVLKDLSPQLSDPTVTTMLGPLPSVRGDAAQLQILFKNLLSDSLRRHRDLVPLHISITTAPCPATEHLRIRITDNGRTEPASTREELLGFLVRLDEPNRWRDTFSANMHLHTSARVVDNHHGRISFVTGPEVSTAIVDLRAWRS